MLRQGGLVAVLSYLDFFQTGVQRTAVHTAAIMCRSLQLDNLEPVSTAVPILTNILQYPVRANTIVAITSPGHPYRVPLYAPCSYQMSCSRCAVGLREDGWQESQHYRCRSCATMCIVRECSKTLARGLGMWQMQ